MCVGRVDSIHWCVCVCLGVSVQGCCSPLLSSLTDRFATSTRVSSSTSRGKTHQVVVESLANTFRFVRQYMHTRWWSDKCGVFVHAGQCEELMVDMLPALLQSMLKELCPELSESELLKLSTKFTRADRL